MHKHDIRKALDVYATRHMPPDADLWPVIRSRVAPSRRRSHVGRIMLSGMNALGATVALAIFAALLFVVTQSMSHRGGGRAAAPSAPAPVAAIPGLSLPPQQLSADEAADVACFQGQQTPQGEHAYIGHQRQVLVAELSQGEAARFLAEQGISGMSPALALDPAVPVFFVVIRGTVTDRLGGPEQILGQALGLVVDRENHVRYMGLGAPWDTLAPPGARPFAPRLTPRLHNVSHARAAGALDGTAFLGPRSLPDGLALRTIDINQNNAQVDPSGTYTATTSVTSVYTDEAAEPHLWFAQTLSPFEIGGITQPETVRIGDIPAQRYLWQQNDRALITLLWQHGDRWLCLTAVLSATWTEQEVIATAASVADMILTPAR